MNAPPQNLAGRLVTPWIPWVLAAVGGVVLGLDVEPVIRGIGLLAVALSAFLLVRQMAAHREVFTRLLAGIPLPDKGEGLIRELPRAWAGLEAEIRRLRTEVEAGDQVRRHILAGLKTGIVLLAGDRRVRLFNPAARALLGASSALGEGAGLADAFREPDSLRALEEAYGGQFREWALRRAPRTLRLRAVPLPGPGAPEEVWVLVTLDDVTHLEALEATRQKFISNASHELKTPVTGIRVAVENLMDGGHVARGGENGLRIILRNLDRMVMLLDDISELSRIETGALRLEPRDLRAGEFLDDVLENAAALAAPRRIRLRAEAPPEVRGLTFRADPMRLGQVLENLLSNAIKFSPEGSEVVLSAEAAEGGLAWTVADQGPGIRAEDLPRIFERFFRAQATRGVPGTGLGLSIVKHLAVLMGGEVGVESLPGRGASFTFRHPLAENEVLTAR
ncbi:sensor histidine kinase [Mesoterricola sediminis]|uniref:histidine kinase n=1 Tax=Mesoterricola sediminis TaxID=2927980 RepID=A0AA48GS45_9BACT|nr:HAMP domain-containing sensor histidine kinase [Mesoterricola sediminis]BDU76614.1 hypothetical protein METESE_15720 [Mesoterricola sediminis]